VAELEEALTTTTADLERVKNERKALFEIFQEEQGKNAVFAAKISEVTTIVGNLQKLTATDPELLRKYSKVYFLSENYSPAQLSSIHSQYLYEKERPQLIHTGTLPRLQDMLGAANVNGLTIRVVSAYRSFYDQAAVKEGYKVTYGSGANQFSADQGYSEHQLGTAVDFSTPGTTGILSGFDDSAAFTWLNANAYKFGFVLSYSKGNTYYQFEPWHWRFVGVALATHLHNENKNFYDLDQREIDGYLITIFN
jgi:D-alanyl-D-alanine carboxypeptidase